MSTSEIDSETIINTFKAMTSDCQQIASKLSELNMDKDEHKLVIDTLKKLEPDRKAFRLVGGVLVERTVKDVLPEVLQNNDGVSKLFVFIDFTIINRLLFSYFCCRSLKLFKN
jgi:prefoldin subunit 2